MSIVPAQFDGTKFAHIEPLMKELLARPVRSREELERWLTDRSDISAACSEARANLYITMTCDTDDKNAARAYEVYITEVDPKLKPYSFELEKRFVALAQQFELPGERYTVLVRGAKAEVELFREENIPLETKLSQLGQKFETLAGSMTVQFEGQERTLPQMARYQEMTDRATRESAWRAVSERRFKEVDNFNAIYDEMIGLRHKVAKNAGFENYIGYAYKSKHRFDYSVKECEDFHAGVEKAVVPLVRALEKKRAKELGVDVLRPWDLAVDPKGRGPLKPFNGGRELMSKSVAAMKRLDSRLAGLLSELGDGSETRGARDGACLDLDSRKGKAPGGYQYMRDRSRRPFIFMNAAGLHRDMTTMLHEAGHAFHSTLCKDEPLVSYRHAPIEYCEVASMSMELLTMPYWDEFYKDSSDLARARRKQIEESVTLLPWIATIDAFQQWVYANPMHTREDRTAFWLTLDERFGHALDWSGLEKFRAKVWQRQSHLFGSPFYYIEYGIAQLGALGLWVHALERGEKSAVEAYVRGMSLGGSKPLPQLFGAAGLDFDFGPAVVEKIVKRVERELEMLPE